MMLWISFLSIPDLKLVIHYIIKTKYFSLQYIFQTHSSQTEMAVSRLLYCSYCSKINYREAKLISIQNRYRKQTNKNQTKQTSKTKQQKRRIGKRLDNDTSCIHKQVKYTVCTDILHIFCCRTKFSWSVSDSGRLLPSAQTSLPSCLSEVCRIRWWQLYHFLFMEIVKEAILKLCYSQNGQTPLLSPCPLSQVISL